MIKTFAMAFKDEKIKPALVLKTSSAGFSVIDRENMIKKIKEALGKDFGKVPVYLLHGDMADYQLNGLYEHPKVKVMLNFTKGEGFGRPLLEFTLAKKPLIVTAWSGHTDFLFMENTCMVGGSLRPVHPSAQVKDMILAESAWFSPDLKQVEYYLKDVFEKYSKYQEKAKKQAHQSKIKFSFVIKKHSSRKCFCSCNTLQRNDRQTII